MLIDLLYRFPHRLSAVINSLVAFNHDIGLSWQKNPHGDNSLQIQSHKSLCSGGYYPGCLGCGFVVASLISSFLVSVTILVWNIFHCNFNPHPDEVTWTHGQHSPVLNSDMLLVTCSLQLCPDQGIFPWRIVYSISILYIFFSFLAILVPYSVPDIAILDW